MKALTQLSAPSRFISFLAVVLFAWSAEARVPEAVRTADFPVQLVAAKLCPGGDLVIGLGVNEAVYFWNLASSEIREVDLEGNRFFSSPACSVDEKWVAIPTMEGSVLIIDGRTGTIRRKLPIASEPVVAVALSPDSALLAAAVANRPGEIWDVRTGKRVAVLVTDFGGSARFAFSPDGALLASADEDTSLRFYNRTGQLLAIANSLTMETFAARFTRDGKQLIVAGMDHALSFVDVGTGRVVRRLEGLPDTTLALDLSPDGRRLFTFQNDVPAFRRPSMSVWDLQAGTSKLLPGEAGHAIPGGWDREGRFVVFVIDGERKLSALAVE